MPKKKRRVFLKNNGLSLAYLLLFLLCLGGQSLAGWRTYNKDQAKHQESQTTYVSYLGNSHFWQAVGENWESEFLQMSFYVFFTIFLFQKGSSESKDPEGREPVDREPSKGRVPKDAPWPVHQGGMVYAIYKNSLTLVFLLLFLLSFSLHAVTGVRKHNAEETAHGGQDVGLPEYLFSSDFWFESLQNWQSEFLAVFSMVFLSIYLRQKGSPESKPVAAAHAATGE